MKKFAVILSAAGIAIFVIAAALFLLGYFRPKGAGIFVETNPASTVYIDGTRVGRTRYEATRKPGEIILKLVPDATSSVLPSYEVKVTLSPGIKTIVRRDFGETNETSAGEIISFERVGGNEASLSIVSIPDAAQISIDGVKIAFAPYKTSSLLPGEHQVIVSTPGYLERSFSVNTISGYKLIGVVTLAPNRDAAPSPTPTPQPEKQTLVEILPTDTGFLRVRSEPGFAGKEVGQVKPGERFLYLDSDVQTGWFKIEYEAGKEGWVTNAFSKQIEGVLDN